MPTHHMSAKWATRLALLGLTLSIIALIMAICSPPSHAGASKHPPESKPYHSPGKPTAAKQPLSVTQKVRQSQAQLQSLHNQFNPTVNLSNDVDVSTPVTVSGGGGGGGGSDDIVIAPGLGGFGSGPCTGEGFQASGGASLISLGGGVQLEDTECTLRENIRSMIGLAQAAAAFGLTNQAQQLMREALEMRNQLRYVRDAQARLNPKQPPANTVSAPQQSARGVEIRRINWRN